MEQREPSDQWSCIKCGYICDTGGPDYCPHDGVAMTRVLGNFHQRCMACRPIPNSGGMSEIWEPADSGPLGTVKVGRCPECDGTGLMQ